VVLGEGSGKKTPPQAQKGQDTAAENHIRSAYRFLEKGMPDKAEKELQKARAKSSQSYWYYYYMGGINFYRGMYKDAQNQWELAFKYAYSSASQSRVRTCQSFAFYSYGNMTKSRDCLQIALEIDSGNSMARILISDFENIGDSPDNKGKGKKEKSQNRANGKDYDKGKKVGQKSQFDGYFLIEPRG
jgi:tetratricopeptide (TPR) repeat protein